MLDDYIELNPWHKRQAALILHFTSNEYIQGLLSQIDGLVRKVDMMLEERLSVDAVGLAVANWDSTDTAAHFSTLAFPALQDYRGATAYMIAMRASEFYSAGGENQCSRMLDEYGHSMLWATPEQENFFRDEIERIFRYGGKLNAVAKRPSTISDCWFWIVWGQGNIDRSRIPRFRVRTDIVARSDEAPPRTGIYVCKDDPYAALQFAWTGGYGELGPAVTFSEFGHHLLRRVGRNGLWDDKEGLWKILEENRHVTEFGWTNIQSDEIAHVASYLARGAFDERPSDWYFVELIEGEYEDIDGTYAGVGSASVQPNRMPAGKSVPMSGWWYSPAQGVRRYFKQDEVFPTISSSDWGDTFWLWALDQSAPNLG